MLTTRRSRSHAFTTRFGRIVATAVAGLLVVGASVLTTPAAHAATVAQDGMTFETDDATLTATITAYDDSATTLVIPATITDPITSTDYAVTTIGNEAFRNTGLTTVTIPDSVTTIGDYAFSGTPLTSVTIGDSVTTIGNHAFRDTDLTTVTIPNSVTTIGNSAFRYTGLTTVTIPDSVTTIGIHAFYGTDLPSVTIPNSVTTIGNWAFRNTDLTTVTIGNSVTTIGGGAFSNTGLTTVTIPNSVTTIGGGAFFSTPLTSAVFQGAPPTGFTANGTSGSLGDNPSVTVYYPIAFAADYAPGGATTWQGYNTAPGATLSFDLGGQGAAIDGVTVIPGNPIASPPPPTASGYTFDGWFATSATTTPFDFGAPLTADTTVFAGWTAIAAAIPAATLPPTGATPVPAAIGGALLLTIGILLMSRRRTRAL